MKPQALRPSLLATLIACTFPGGHHAHSAEPALLLDFRNHKMEAAIAPGEKRMGRVHYKGVLKDPLVAREGKRGKIQDHLREGEHGPYIILAEPMSLDVFGALNPQSGTLATTYRFSGQLIKGGELFSVRATFSGSPQRGPMAWKLAAAPSQEGDTVVLTLECGGLSAQSDPIILNKTRPVTLAISWDVTKGVQLWVDGQAVGMASLTLPKTEVDLPVERMEIHSYPDGELHTFSLYPDVLTPENLERLSKREPLKEPLAAKTTETLPPPDWNRDGAPLQLKPKEPLRLKDAIILDAREEGLRAGGWLAVDGQLQSAFPWWHHGYRQLPVRMLEITLSPQSAPTLWSLNGNVTGTLSPVEDSERELPPIELDGGKIGYQAVPPAHRYRLRVSKGFAHEVSFLTVDRKATPAKGRKLLITPVADASAANRHELQTRYHAASRQVFGVKAKAATAAPSRFAANQAWHLITPPQDELFALGEVGFQLRLATPLTEPTRLKVTIHSPDSAFHHLSQHELTLLPGKGNYEFWIDLRDTALLKGDTLWITLQAEHPLHVRLGKGGTSITLAPAANRDEALALWKESLWRTTRNHFESISEPRPWSGINDNPESAWWLRQMVPAYTAIERGLERLRSQFPKDERFVSAYYFTHPQAPNPAKNLPLPEAEPGVPRWAHLMRENLRLYKQFVHWWIDHRQHANGEFGHWYGDDSDLLQEWTTLAFISDPDRKVRNSFAKLSEAIATQFSFDGVPIIQNGLNTRYTDSLHAYEEGLNLQPSDFLLHYGHPEKFARLLQTISRYDGFLLAETEVPGELRFAGGPGSKLLFFNTKRPPKGGHLAPSGYLFLHSALMAGWYQNDPKIWNYLESVGRWTLKRTDPAQKSGYTSTLLLGLYLHTGNPQWLSPFFEPTAWANGKIDFRNQPPLPEQIQLRLSREAARAKLPTPDPTGYFDRLGSEKMAESDRRFMEKWLEWQLTGNEDALYEGLEAQWRKHRFILPTVTVAEMSGDRVAIAKHLLAQLYLGGSPGARNHDFYPDFAVSYEGWDDFAAMVEEATPDQLRLRFYLFGKQAVRGTLRTWKLAEGTYRVELKREDGKTTVLPSTFLQRGDGVEVEIPANETVQLTFVQESRSSSDKSLRADAALHPEGKGLRREGNELLVPVYNLGSVALDHAELVARDAKGQLLAQSAIGTLPPMQPWKPGETLVHLPLPPDSQGAVTLEVRTSASEVTRRNNTATVTLP